MNLKTYEDVLTIISDICQLFKKETIQLKHAHGRIIAEHIYADRDYPPFNRAAMDGYAIMSSDWEKGIRTYHIIESIFTGKSPERILTTGSCYKIMTGAPTPKTANIIIRKEDATELKNQVFMQVDQIKIYQNIAVQGQDSKKGTLLLQSPLKCTPQIIALLATVGKTNLQVFKLPTTALVTTGDEIVDPSLNIGPLQIRNSNQFLLSTLLEQWTIKPVLCTHVSDDKIKLTATLRKALKAELLVVNGAVSAGDADYVPIVLTELGVDILVHKVSIRPGKPILIGKAATGTIIFALPGNPLSCLSTFTVFVEHFLALGCGLKKRRSQTFPLLESISKKHAFTEFVPAGLQGLGKLQLFTNNGSGDITSYTHATGLAMLPAEAKEIKKNEPIIFYPFNSSH
jgi:molybdopterin molybdotransferase